MSAILTFGALLLLFFSQGSLGYVVANRFFSQLSFLAKVLVGSLLCVTSSTSLLLFLALVWGPAVYWLLLIPTVLGIVLFPTFFRHAVAAAKNVRRNIWAVAAIATATLSLASTVALSGIPTQNGVSFQETHDNLWHVALVEALLEQVPPAHPAFPAIQLENYHYFYDAWIAVVAHISQAPVTILYFQVFSVVTAGILSLAAYVLGRKLGGTVGGVLLVFFTAFVGSFAYMIPWFLPGQLWHESSFWVSQTFIMMLNPQIIFTLAVTYSVMLLLLEKQKTTAHHLALSILIATSIGFKSYAWVMLSVVYGLYLLVELLQTRKLHCIYYGVFFIVLSLPFVWLITGFKSGTFFYQPMWYIETMIEAPDRLNYLPWKYELEFYQNKGNWLKVLQIQTQEVVIFFGGNLGTRVLFLLLPIVLLFKWREFTRSQLQVAGVVFGGFLFASVFPLLFLQTGVVWNSIQFWYYALIFANVLAVMVLVKIKEMVPLWVAVLGGLLLIGLSIPTYLHGMASKLQLSRSLTPAQVTFLNSLQPTDRVLVCPEETELYRTLLISSYSPAQTYFAQPVQLNIVGADAGIEAAYVQMFAERRSEDLAALIQREDITQLICSDQATASFMARSTSEQGEPTQVDSWFVFTP